MKLVKEGESKRFENIHNHTLAEKEIDVEIINVGNDENVIIIEKQRRDGSIEKTFLTCKTISKINELLGETNDRK